MVLRYNPSLKPNSRRLRSNMTDSERLLWSKLRGKQILKVQFYRQKPLGNYIVDFFASAVKLIVEVDGGQHMKDEGKKKDVQRDAYLKTTGFKVLRFDNLQVLKDTEAVLEVIYRAIKKS